MKQIVKRGVYILMALVVGILIHGYSQSVSSPSTTDQSQLTPQQKLQAQNDSIAAMRTYMKSKAYNDSIDRLRKARIDSMRAQQDALKLENQRIKDSIQDAFQEQKRLQQLKIDSIKLDRQKVVDSLNEVKRYRNSREYKDSVAAIKQRHIDSMKQVRQQFMDSAKAEQKRQLDSMKVLQQQRNDSLQNAVQARNDSMRAYIDGMKAQQQKFKDSLEIVKQNRVDSLQKLKEAREDELWEKEKQREKEIKERERAKVLKERDEYTNDQLLKRGWGLRRRVLQNTFTRYNYFYNATNKLNEAEKNMYVSKIDNFDSLLSLYPYDPSKNSTLFSSDMDSLSKRLSIGIQIHDPRSKWQDDLYLYLGQAYYYKGDFQSAEAVFEYVINYDKKYDIKKKDKNKKDDKNSKNVSSNVLNLDTKKKGLAGLFQHDMAKNEGFIWLAKTYIKQKQYDKAQILLDMIKIDPNAGPALLAQVYEVYAELHLDKKELQSALPYLDSVAFNHHLGSNIRQRAAYLGGQLYAENADWTNAEKMFSKVVELHAPVEMDLNASLNKIVAQSFSDDDNFNKIIRQLTKMSKEDKYKMYYDRINMSLAQTYLRNGEKDNAIAAYNKAITLSSNSPSTKGLAYYELGDLYYNSKDYVLAQNAYDSARVFLETSGKKDVYDRSVAMSNNLKVISVPASQIQTIDSVLALTEMTDKEKQLWARQELKKYEESFNQPKSLMTNSPGGGDKGGFYFTNTDQLLKGAKDFKQQWGDRPLVDNWRRSGDIKFMGTASGGDEGYEDVTAGKKIDEKYFISQIPTSPQVIDSLKNQLEKSYVELEKTFYITEEYSSLKDLYSAFYEKYPRSNYLDQFYHDMFMVYMRENKVDSAQYFKEKLNNEFSQSPLALAVSNFNINNAGSDAFVDNTAIESHMDQTYALLNAQMYTEVITRSEEAKKQFPMQIAKYQSQYDFMKGVAYAGMKNYDYADTLLNDVIKHSKDDKLKLQAGDVLNFIREAQNIESIDTTTSSASTISFLDPTLISTQYVNNKNEKHYVLVYVEKSDNRIMPLRAGIMDYNTMKKSELGLKTTFSDLKANERLIVIKELKNDPLAKKYISDLKAQKEFFKDYKMNLDIKIVSISESNFIILLNKKDFLEYLTFYNKNY